MKLFEKAANLGAYLVEADEEGPNEDEVVPELFVQAIKVEVFADAKISVRQSILIYPSIQDGTEGGNLIILQFWLKDLLYF